MTPEQRLNERIRREIEARGGFYQRIETTTGLGIPDIYAVIDGKSLWIESKIGPRIRIEQFMWHILHNRRGGLSYVVSKIGSKHYYVQITDTKDGDIDNISDGKIRITKQWTEIIETVTGILWPR